MRTLVLIAAALKRERYLVGCFILLTGIAFGLSATCVSDAMAQNATSCINNTKDEAQCKDCCDCISGDAAARKACRDQCPTHDFALNSNFITVNAPSILGPDGDYSAAVSAESEQACKEYCDGSTALSCGDQRFCRDACAETFGGNQPPPDGGGISIEQAISDEAQSNTIAFDGLAFLTGDLCSDTFLPPGKVADFSGFQYLRDTDPTNMGHNTDFVTIIAFNILNILTENQRSALITLAKNQVSQINEYGYKRFPLMKAFRRLIAGDLPTGCTGLDRSAVMAYSAELYQLDGQISYDRAKTLGTIIRGMTSQQRARMDALKALNGVGNWNKTLPDPLKGMNLDHDVNVAVMTYASEMYSWYAGSVEADTYFCPERQGTYFGSFYMKDAPAMAAGPGFTIPSNLTADMGSSFLSSLTSDQAGSVIDLVNIQRNDLNEIVATRRSISTQLRRFITESSVDSTTVLNLARRYGELDGEIVYNYATHFVQVSKTLSSNQEAQLMALRETWNTIPCSGAYLYSAKINMPEIMNTDFLFGASGGNGVTAGSIVKVADGFTFAEGPAADAAGNIFFSDVTANKIYKWSTGGQLSVFLENSGGANGLFFDGQGNLLACQGANGRVVSIDSQGKVSVLAEKYNGMRFNEPNDLWIDPKGGVYFSDPLYFGKIRYQNGEHVYYLTPNRDNIIQVVNDLVRPNGIIGTPDGKTLYVADHGAGKIYRYSIAQNGSLTDKTLFASSGSDGMTIDDQGNIYLTTGSTVLVYSSSGSLIETIDVPLQPTNVCFGGSDGKTLFITAKTALYALPMQVKGVSYLRRGTAADELVLNWGSPHGLYHYDQAGGWKQWNTVSPSQMVTADLNGDGGDELIAAFPGYGLYTYDSANGWQLINSMIPEGMVTYRNGIACDYGTTYGLWHWTQTGGWEQLNTADPGLMTAVDIDKDGVDEIAVAFPGYGLYIYDQPNHWTRINTIIPENMIRLNNGIACDYGAGRGLWYWTQASGWKQRNTADPGQMVATDVNNDGMDELVVSFPGYGLYYDDGTGAWRQINTAIPENMIGQGNGVAVDFGAAYGLWVWSQTGGWMQRNTVDPGQMVAVDIDKDGVEELTVCFSGYGLYYFDETNGWQLLNSVIPEDMKPISFYP